MPSTLRSRLDQVRRAPFVYPAALHDPARTALLPPRTFLGSAVRAGAVPEDVRDWLDGSVRPVGYVSFGSFLSARADVLATVMTALRAFDVRVAVATGSARGLPDAPADWLVRPYLPQVALLECAVLAVTDGGTNSVTEALTAGVPMVVLPFSTDQFAGAAAIELAGLGVALDPNAATADDLFAAIREAWTGAAHQRALEVGERLRAVPGRDRARAAIGGVTAYPGGVAPACPAAFGPAGNRRRMACTGWAGARIRPPA